MDRQGNLSRETEKALQIPEPICRGGQMAKGILVDRIDRSQVAGVGRSVETEKEEGSYR